MRLPEVHQPHQPFVTTTFATRTVAGQGVSLATRDYGGSGSALVLMHGAGMDQRSLEPLAEQLQSVFRVITFDFRGHGSTSSSPWTFASAVSDLGAVATAYGLGVPAVGGHSLGGMVAAGFGREHPSCPGVINIDGQGRGRVEQYVGYDEAEVRQHWAKQDRRIDQLTNGIPAALIRGLLLALRKPAVRPETARQVMREVDALDLFTLYRELTCPLLVFNATAPEDGRLMKRLAGDGGSFVGAYRKGLERDLALLAAERPRTEVATVDATHMLIRTHPELVARRITTFLQAVVP
jgi:pimeloyl-ACP methyl ester carboxylesterase